MEEERHYNELTGYGHVGHGSLVTPPMSRARTTSSPVPTRPLSPNDRSNSIHSHLLIYLVNIKIFHLRSLQSRGPSGRAQSSIRKSRAFQSSESLRAVPNVRPNFECRGAIVVTSSSCKFATL